MISVDTEYSLLESIEEAEASPQPLTQRILASRAGLSLGMTNALLRRLAGRGWVKLTRVSARNIRYALTPEGVAEILRRTAGHFRRASLNAERYRAQVESFISKEKRRGTSTLVLAGTSELDFLFEFLCDRHGIAFVKTADMDRARALARRPAVVLLLAESVSSLNVSRGRLPQRNHRRAEEAAGSRMIAGL